MTRTVTLAGYVVLVMLMIGCELEARRSGRNVTLERAITRLSRWRPVWWFVLAGWLWIGWHLFVRVGR